MKNCTSNQFDFSGIVENHFKPIATRNHFEFEIFDGSYAILSSSQFNVKIQFIPSHSPDVSVAFYLNDPQWQKNSSLNKWGINLLNVVEYFNSKFDFADLRLNSHNLWEKMVYLAALLDSHLGSLASKPDQLWAISKRIEKELSQAK